MRRLGILIWVLVLGAAVEAGAHAITALSVVSDFKADGGYRFELGVDVTLTRDPEDESGVQVADPGAPLTAEEILEVENQVREYIETSLRFHLDEKTFVPAFEIEEAGDLEGAEAPPEYGDLENAPRKRYAAHATGTIPAKAVEFLLEATPDAVAPVVFIIFRDGKPTRHSQVLYSGEYSRPVNLAAIRSGEAMPGRKPQMPPKEEGKDVEAEAEVGADEDEVAVGEERGVSWRTGLVYGGGAVLLFLVVGLIFLRRKG